MREIKYRLWDKKEGHYYDPDYPVIKPNGKIYETVFGELDEVITNHVDFEQYTGLKDESDVEIYEGDIVRVALIDGESGYIDEVIWGGKDGYPAFDLKHYAADYDANALSSISEAGFETIEVIGNIHENPELLEAGE